MSAPLQCRDSRNDHADDTLGHKVVGKLADSRFFAVSLTIHVLLIALAGSVVVYKSYIEPEEFTPAGIPIPIERTIETEEPLPEIKVGKLGAAQLPSLSSPDLPVIFCFGSPSTFSSALPSTPGKIPLPGSGGVDVLGLPSLAAGNIPAELAGRLPGKREVIGKARGEKPRSEMAVLRGLEWLRVNQNDDGSWGDANRPAMTGLGLLCFLGHGELPDSKQYGLTVNKAVQWLIDNGTKHGGRLNMEDRFTQTGVYEHGIATYALGEYFAMTQDERVVELLRQAVAHIVQGQGPGGGWMYSFHKTADDLSVSGWQIQALKAAHLTKLNLPGVDQALDKAIRHIENAKGPKGGYGYRGPDDRYSLTGVGMLARIFWKGDHGQLQKGMTWVLDETEKNKPVKYKSQSADLYAWYYHTQACLLFGGSAWTKWNRWFQDELCDVQNSDGSWPAPGGRAPGPQSQESRTGATYRTTLCLLMLEVFYRYMPTAQEN